jgi:protoheme IX farnesyltransferase
MVYPKAASIYQDLRTLVKSKVVQLMLLTTLVGMLFTPPIFWNYTAAIAGMIGIACAAYSAGILNQILEKNLDQQMQRTQRRPLAKGSIRMTHASILCAALALTSILILYRYTNLLTLLLTSISMLGYSWFYTQILKPNTSQNIVIGGLFGALPPLLGWSALTNTISAQPLVLVAIIYTWTPPHFWCLALTKIDDYQKANLPMLPNTHGVEYTKISILCYSVLLMICTQLPFLLHMVSIYSWLLINILNATLVYMVYQVYTHDSPKVFLRGFLFSNLYLATLFMIMTCDRLWHIL